MKSITFLVQFKKVVQALAVLTCCLAFAIAAPRTSNSQSAQKPPAQQQELFGTPNDAVDALVSAAESSNVAALEEIFGAAGTDIVSTGDPVADKNVRDTFVQKARQNTRIVLNKPRNRAIVYIGDDNFPLPIPLVKQKTKWRFDTKAGRDEIVARRIGGNELNAIDICEGYVEAQREYAEQIHDRKEPHQYAQRVISTPGKHDGLYWKNEDGTPGGPIGEAVARAIEQGYTTQGGKPFHGYYFKILKGQGRAAHLGALDYLVKGAMIGGFALVAAPAQYRVTGVQTFIVSNDGVVYQKDLGPKTLNIVKSMELYNPDKTWRITSTADYANPAPAQTRH